MDNEISIRRASVDDLEDIARIYNWAILNTTSTFDVEPKTLDDRLVWFTKHTDDYPIVVAVIRDKVVGWGSIRPFGERQAYRRTVENAVYIDCDYQGRGVGTAILGELIEQAERLGYHVIMALVVGGNDASVRLHAKLGFEQVGVMREVGWKFGQWLDIILLEKILVRSH